VILWRNSRGGFSNAFNKTSTNPKLSPSPFQSSGFGQNSQFGQTGFGSQAPKNIFGAQTQNNNIFGAQAQNNNIFGVQAQSSPGIGNSVFGGILSLTFCSQFVSSV
jgi:hypothetical protein